MLTLPAIKIEEEFFAIQSQIKKIREEVEELNAEAIKEPVSNSALVSEALDVFNAVTTLLSHLDISEQEVRSGLVAHHNKLHGREEKGLIKIKEYYNLGG